MCYRGKAANLIFLQTHIHSSKCRVASTNPSEGGLDRVDEDDEEDDDDEEVRRFMFLQR